MGKAGKEIFIAVRMNEDNMYDKIARLEQENSRLHALLASKDESIQKQEQRYKTIFENIQDVYYETDSCGIIVELSPSVSDFSAYSREELIGKPITTLYEDPHLREEYLKELFINAKLIDLEVVGRDKFGRRVDGLVNVQLLRNEAGQVTGTVGSFRDITRRKHLEIQLQESESRFRLIFETTSNIAVRGFTSDGTIKYWNRASEDLYGFTAEEAIGKNLLDLIIPLKMRNDVSEKIAEMVVSGHGGSSEELVLMRCDGSFVPVISSHTVIAILGQEPELFSVDIDLSERRNAEEALVVSESMYRTLFEANIDGIAIFSINPDNAPGKFLEMNSAAAAMLGYRKEEMLLLSPKDIEVTPTPETIQNRQQELQAKGSVSFETKLRHKGGDSLSVEISAVLIQYRGLISVMNITRDISERKRTEAMLRMLSNATEQSPTSIVITDSEGNIEYINPSFTKVSGYSYEEIIGKNPDILKSGFTPIEVYESMWKSLRLGQTWSGEFHNKRRNGELFYESSVISPIFDEEGNVSHFVGVKEDITARKSAEDALQQSERILREAQEVARVGHYIFNIIDNRWESSPVLDDIFGIDSSYEHSLNGWLSLIAPEQRDMVYEHLNESIKEYGRFKKDYKIIRLCDGGERWVSGLGEVEYDASGTAIKMMGTIQDITDRVQYQNEIVEAKERAEASENRLRQSETQLRIKLDKILSPDVEMPDFMIADIIEIDQLQVIQDALSAATGVASIIINPNGTPITKPSNFGGACKFVPDTSTGILKCEAFNNNAESPNVAAGVTYIEACGNCEFIDAVTPIYIGNKLVATWLIGKALQPKTSEVDLVTNANEPGADPAQIQEEHYHTSDILKGQFKAATNLMTFIGRELSSLAFHNLLLARSVNEHKEFEYRLVKAKEDAEANERLIKEKSNEYSALNEELSEVNAQLEEYNEVIQKKVAEIKEREAILNSVINNVPFDLWARDMNGVCFLQNDASKLIWGSMQGKTPVEMDVPKETLDLWLRNNARIHEGETFNEEMEVVDAFGVTRFVNSIVAPIIENDQILGILGLDIDISERIKFERDIIKAKEKAEESDRLKSAFLATMSHELRTPLNAIIGFSQILTGVHELEKVTGFSQIINQQGKHLLGIIEAMFELSMLDAGEVRVKVEPFELATLLDSFSQIAIQSQKKWNRTRLEIKHASIPKSSSLLIASDLMKLKVVLSNLIDNAVKFTPDGLVEYGFSVSDSDLTIFVKDTGKGIDFENFNIIFAPFRQVDDGFSREFDGVGLGLAICKKMVSLLNGDITVQSEVGKGSTFSVVLHNAIEGKNTAQVKADDSVVITDLTGFTILVAEHDSNSQALIGKYIQEGNGTVIVAKDGKEAVELALKHDQISLVLMDVKMTIINGIEAMQRIKEAKPDMPVIALTAFAMPGDQAKLVYYGFDDYLSKPVKPEQLNAKVNQYLKRN